MNGLPRLLYEWLSDESWVAAAGGIPSAERRALLIEAGAATFDNDWGGYASRLRGSTKSLDYIWAARDREQLLRRHTQELLVNLSDTLDFRHVTASELFDQVTILGDEHLHSALDAGRGVLLLSVHQSHPGFGFLHPAWRGIGVSTVANLGDRTAPQASLLLDGLRDRVEILPTTAAALRPMIARLARGECVAIYADFLYPGTPGIPSALLGGVVKIASAPVALALRTGAAVVPVLVARQESPESEGVLVEFGARLPLSELDPRDPAAQRAAALAFGIAMEGMIRRAPATWRLWGSLTSRWRAAERQLIAEREALDRQGAR
jgi:lauroyl/myristoyl acyltransferase